MPGTFVLDARNTFSRVRLVGCEPKNRFRSEEQDTNRDGVPKWTLEAVVSWQAVNGMPAPKSEVIEVTVTAPRDPAESAGVEPGQEIGFDAVWMGVQSPEVKENGGVKGGRPWYGASAIHPASPSANGNGKATAAASAASAKSSAETGSEG